MALASLDSLSPAAQNKVWRGDEMSQADHAVCATGFAALDAQLPGGGWPVGAMTEIMLDAPEQHAWQLLAPALARATQAGAGAVTLVGPPCEPFGPALAAQGLPLESLLWVRSEAAAARLWACEQALRCADMAAVLAWLPQARVGELRRLQLAAAQHDLMLFVFRPASAAQQTSPARLRLQATACAQDPGLIDLHILKRRGPPLTAPVQLPARGERMASLLAASRLRRKLRRQQEGELVTPSHRPLATVLRLGLDDRKAHALDRLAVAA